MKLCLCCNKRDEDGCWSTCPACGEASWLWLEPKIDLSEARPLPSATEPRPDPEGASVSEPDPESENRSRRRKGKR